MKTIKIKPSHESQGEYVLINEADFDSTKHELLDADEIIGDETGEALPEVGKRAYVRKNKG